MFVLRKVVLQDRIRHVEVGRIWKYEQAFGSWKLTCLCQGTLRVRPTRVLECSK